MSASRAQRLRRRAMLALAALWLIGATAGSTARAGAASRVQATQELAVLSTAHGVRRAPEAAAVQTSRVAARRPITGEATTLPVLARSIGADGTRWLLVALPGRPNGSSGWIAQRGTRLLVTPWRIVVGLAARRVLVYRDGRLARAFAAVVGKPSTPTPTGVFFVEEALRMSTGEAGGPFALALSARSNVLQEFEGGAGQIAIHGRDNLGGTLGSAASHGCVRVATASVDWLAKRIGPGTPVTIE